MGFFSGVKKAVKPLVNFPRWMDLGRVNDSGKMIGGLIKRVLVPRKPTRKETFQEAMVRLRLTEADIQRREKEFLRLVYFFSVITILAYFYSFYLITHSYVRAGILALIISSIALAQVFRFHFWYFQTKKRKLGCTFREWLWQGLLGRSQ